METLSINDKIQQNLNEVSISLMKNKWSDSQFEKVKLASPTVTGTFGENVSKTLWESIGLECEIKPGRRGDWDTYILLDLIKKFFENKTATEDKNGSFQFNGVKLNRKYDYLFCLGVSPDQLYFKIISKSDIELKKEWGFCSMTKKNSSEDKMSLSYKVTINKKNMIPIEKFNETIMELFNL
jgi:hypothetical protein